MKKNSRNRQLILVLCVIWTLLALIFAYVSYSVADGENNKISAVHFVWMNLIKFNLWFIFLPFIFRILENFGIQKVKNLFLNFLIHIGFCGLFSFLQMIIYTPFVWIFEAQKNIPYPTFSNFFERYYSTLFEKYNFFANLFLNVLLYSLLVLIIQGFLLLKKYQTEESRNALLKAELADAQLQSLKMQLQPHFLFNTLHSISSLNLSNPLKANQMIARLGDFLRMTLDSADEQMVSLAEELEFLRCYLEIEQIRFSDRLSVEFDIADETLSAEVPHLILQPIVENAVKHGIAPHSAQGKIYISAHKSDGKLFLQIKDDCAKINKIATKNGKGKGLKNVRSRLEQLYENRFRLTLNETENGMKVDLETPLARSELRLQP